jgi:hypothetical protein
LSFLNAIEKLLTGAFLIGYIRVQAEIVYLK